MRNLVILLVATFFAVAPFAANAEKARQNKNFIIPLPVNVNQASAEVLDRVMDGVGPAKAQAIIAYREANGPFKSIDDLGNVKGIGAGTLERNRGRITVD